MHENGKKEQNKMYSTMMTLTSTSNHILPFSYYFIATCWHANRSLSWHFLLVAYERCLFWLNAKPHLSPYFAPGSAIGPISWPQNVPTQGVHLHRKCKIKKQKKDFKVLHMQFDFHRNASAILSYEKKVVKLKWIYSFAIGLGCQVWYGIMRQHNCANERQRGRKGNWLWPTKQWRVLT
jgi:hypothetical protein